jgi:hypothetical protein
VTSAGLAAVLHAALARELPGAVRLRHDLLSRALVLRRGGVACGFRATPGGWCVTR